MCESCGCGLTAHAAPGGEASGIVSVRRDDESSHTITVMRGILAQNSQQAAHNREHFDAHGVLAVNLMSAPGSGKTALLERTIDELAGRLRCAVIEGDLETDNDARRIRGHGVPAIQVTTGSTCHLDAAMVHEALHQLPLEGLDVLFIENVGNLVCPASFALGTHVDVALLSVPEGDDKPAKYPVMFRAASLVVVSKADLLPLCEDFDVSAVAAQLRALANPAPLLTVSSRTGLGIPAWIDWITAAVVANKARPGTEMRARTHHHAPPARAEPV